MVCRMGTVFVKACHPGGQQWQTDWLRIAESDWQDGWMEDKFTPGLRRKHRGEKCCHVYSCYMLKTMCLLQKKCIYWLISTSQIQKTHQALISVWWVIWSRLKFSTVCSVVWYCWEDLLNVCLQLIPFSKNSVQIDDQLIILHSTVQFLFFILDICLYVYI